MQKKVGREKKPIQSRYKWLGFWRGIFTRCKHDWIYQQTFNYIGNFCNETHNVFTCSKCGYSIHKPGNVNDIEFKSE